MNSRQKNAHTVSVFTNPPILCIPLFLIISLTLSLNDLWKFPILELISLIFASVLPMAIILYWAKKTGDDSDISTRENRFTPLIVGTISYLIGFVFSLILNVDSFLSFLLLCYATNTFIVMLITTKWKISIHTTGLSGPVCALIMLLGPIGALFGLIYPVLIWSRVTLKKHTMAQAISGGVFGFVFTALDMYLFIFLFNLNITNIIPIFDVFGYIMAIIATPIVLGILTYLNKKNMLLFYLIEIILFCFFAAVMSSLEIVIIFVLTTVVSILISNYAGKSFEWYGIIK